MIEYKFTTARFAGIPSPPKDHRSRFYFDTNEIIIESKYFMFLSLLRCLKIEENQGQVLDNIYGI